MNIATVNAPKIPPISDAVNPKIADIGTFDDAWSEDDASSAPLSIQSVDRLTPSLFEAQSERSPALSESRLAIAEAPLKRVGTKIRMTTIMRSMTIPRSSAVAMPRFHRQRECT